RQRHTHRRSSRALGAPALSAIASVVSGTPTVGAPALSALTQRRSSRALGASAPSALPRPRRFRAVR
ncbi:hypothetical protein, partial [Streptomyces sp. NPDC004629]|uniref:hypothetical protein n=1 Tax=Streptomyces sp. NPDC004629 TaxID=3364705 RepID=UPI0036C28790